MVIPTSVLAVLMASLFILLGYWAGDLFVSAWKAENPTEQFILFMLGSAVFGLPILSGLILALAARHFNFL